MSLAILFHFLRAQHVSDINISSIRSLRLSCWITTSVVLFSVRCVLEIWCGWFWVVLVLHNIRFSVIHCKPSSGILHSANECCTLASAWSCQSSMPHSKSNAVFPILVLPLHFSVSSAQWCQLRWVGLGRVSDGDSMILRRFGAVLPNYTVSQQSA